MRSLMVSLSMVVIVGCASSGSTVTVGGRPVSMPSDTAEEHEKLIENVGLYDDPELAAYVERVGQQLVANSRMPDQAFTFTLLDSPDINAFALPGGFIYVNRGLLAYLDSEAELAAVLAHEIGHITERHHSRRKTQSVTSQVAAVTAYILTGSGQIYDAASMYGAELISGFGRDMELEADAAGAETMHRTGYEADAMLSVIGVLKDQEQYQRVQARASGKPSGTYHGLYSSHPRNDLRLQTVIRTASALDIDNQPETPEQPGVFQAQVEGLVFGASAEAQSEPDRFYHNNLDFTFAHPPGWSVVQQSRAIVATNATGDATLTITLDRIEPDSTASQALEEGAGGTLSDTEAFEQFGLLGATARSSSAGATLRLAVIDHSYRFLFEGTAENLDAADTDFLEIIRSFRPLVAREKVTGVSRTLHYVQVPRGATLESLSSSARVPDAENQLRLINGYYPVGEPRIGDWVKTIR